MWEAREERYGWEGRRQEGSCGQVWEGEEEGRRFCCGVHYTCCLLLQMEAKLKEKIEPSLTEKVNFSQEMEALHKLVVTSYHLSIHRVIISMQIEIT